ncbi:MAG TPA: AHH domain-containing protein [Steroidobacteraceae bacterium]|nr:AHH domain-containing protein [Steroidobacteraceae bacterium]
MTEAGESVGVGLASQDEDCIFCHKKHKEEEEKKLDDYTYTRNDKALTSSGRGFIKGDDSRAAFYPRDEQGGFVSPLAEPEWSDDVIFKTYKTKSGKDRTHAEKYQPPPIKGWIAAPHHMIAVCCMNGENGLPGVPKVNPWAHKGDYDINRGSNCIFLPSSASQFFVAYYYWKVRGTGRALQGHLGAHRKAYFETVWDRLEKIVRDGAKSGWCTDTDDEEAKKALAKKVVDQLTLLEAFLFRKLSALQPEEPFKLGAESYIAIPEESEPFAVPAGVSQQLQPYETLPKWY